LKGNVHKVSKVVWGTHQKDEKKMKRKERKTVAPISLGEEIIKKRKEKENHMGY